MAKLKAIRNHIIFQFEDDIVTKIDNDTRRTQFAETTSWGFTLSDYDDGTKSPRWGIVKAIGHEVKSNIKIGARILIEPLKWTTSMKFEDELYWRTDEPFVLAVDEDYNINTS